MAADDLYALPPREFTRARDERAKELRKSGDREAADAVKAMRKPTVAAWALNQLSRRRPKDLERLLSAGEELRAAQEELLVGGDRSKFQKAAAKERDLVAELTREAVSLARESGERAGAGLDEKLSETLHAAALDDETAEELGAGRLTREREAIGGFGGLEAAPPRTPPRSRAAEPRGKAAQPQPKAPAKRAAAGARAESAAAQREQAAAAERDQAAAERRERLAAARTDERHARRELDAAAKAAEAAATRAEAAEAHAADAVKRAKTATERLKEARRAQTAAKKAHTRAEKALEAAERS